MSTGSSDVQRLVEDQNRLKYQLKVTRQNNQRLRKTIFQMEYEKSFWNVTNTQTIHNLESKIQVGLKAL